MITLSESQLRTILDHAFESGASAHKYNEYEKFGDRKREYVECEVLALKAMSAEFLDRSQ